MPVFRLGRRLVFPPPALADPDGLLAIGGDLRPKRLLLAYANGIFPWPHEGLPLLWFSPPRRMVLPVGELVVSRRLGRTLRQRRFAIRLDTAFRPVVEGCASAPRRHESGTWITPAVIEAYTRLHELGYAHSAEAWCGDDLVGGLYGVCLGRTFVGESMFARMTDASKVALVILIRQLARWRIDLFDAQVYTAHVARFGGREWPRERYLRALAASLAHPSRRGRWRLDADLG